LSPVSAHNLGVSLGESPRINAKALKCIVAAGEEIIVGLYGRTKGPLPLSGRTQVVSRTLGCPASERHDFIAKTGLKFNISTYN
jgi:hypothetical protein